MRTVFIESGKSHAGWQYARNGLRMGAAVADGTIRKFNLPIFPFFRYKRTVYIMPEVA